MIRSLKVICQFWNDVPTIFGTISTAYILFPPRFIWAILKRPVPAPSSTPTPDFLFYNTFNNFHRLSAVYTLIRISSQNIFWI